ncbi:DUF1822 family protein [Pseudanabaena sp. BC1403]|uniref:DUF1822 family protein n=1 Tax=Pseudanabaena sp. BC1403 TaxID=2043171 RepID=UPI0015E1A280|nr:DUF1822 family protein [Pseudanabaena sp. BC1403]
MLILKIETELESILEDQICLQIPKESQTEIRKKLQGYSYPAAEWMAYLNRLSLEHIIPYFKQIYGCDIELAAIPKKPDSVWEYVTGFALTIDKKRVIVIPDETDSDEFSIPYEWVDIPEWAGEYYLAVQIRPDSGWLRVFGFTTHQQIKQKAEYDRIMRTYILPQEQIIDDIEFLLTSLAIASNQKVDVPALTAIGQTQQNQYLTALKQPKLYSPRLDLSAEHWTTFLSDDDLRETLWQSRMPMPVKSSLQEVIRRGVISLSNLLEKSKIYGCDFIDELMKTPEEIEAFFESLQQNQYATGFRSPATLTRKKEPSVFRTRTVPYLISLIQTDNETATRIESLKLLGKIGQQDQDAIAYLSSLQSDLSEELQIQREAAICLGKIDPCHPQAGIRRVQLIDLTYRIGTIKLSLEVTIMPVQKDKAHVHFYLTAPQEKVLPANLKFEAIDSDGDIIFSIQEQNKDFYQGSFIEEYGGYFQTKISLDDAIAKSEFTV